MSVKAANQNTSIMAFIPSIPTTYKNNQMRSRTEWRWALYFDFLSIEWEYEPQKFYLPTLECGYLPDFYLPKHKCWIEVKGIPPTQLEVEKIVALTEITGKPCICLPGVPDTIAYDMWLPGKRKPVMVAITSHRKTKFPVIALKNALHVGQLFPDIPQAVKFATSARFGEPLPRPTRLKVK